MSFSFRCCGGERVARPVCGPFQFGLEGLMKQRGDLLIADRSWHTGAQFSIESQQVLFVETSTPLATDGPNSPNCRPIC